MSSPAFRRGRNEFARRVFLAIRCAAAERGPSSVAVAACFFAAAVPLLRRVDADGATRHPYQVAIQTRLGLRREAERPGF
jgi:hypothetical protein